LYCIKNAQIRACRVIVARSAVNFRECGIQEYDPNFQRTGTVLMLLAQPRRPSAEDTQTNPERMPQRNVQFAIALALAAWMLVIGGVWWLL
jgi:hypothetical protein